MKSKHRCPITYEDIPAGSRYSQRGLRILSSTLADLRDLTYSAEKQIIEARKRSSEMSIQGVEPKLSAKLRVKESIFSLVEQGGTYILKPPQRLYPFLPENEIHEIGLLYINYEINLRGYKSIYLGQTVPLDTLKDVMKYFDNLYFLSYFTVVPSKPKPSPVNDIAVPVMFVKFPLPSRMSPPVPALIETAAVLVM